ncbi:hypothetical protein HK097_001035 [Rhizophlyctis rosea]|uniref:Uncharacterized protein n=1 Tax=Rhizophlyctis rosea TaxID=64517 RepID=A0AAD5SMP5_9FUNG|nr:hypothetical protein HK097_001035 [Rhizophlyctis rosea]
MTVPQQTYPDPHLRYLGTHPENYNQTFPSPAGGDAEPADKLQRFSAGVGRLLSDIVRSAVGEESDKQARALVLDIISAETNRLREADSLATYHNILGQNSGLAETRQLPEDLSEINDVSHLLRTPPTASSPDDAPDVEKPDKAPTVSVFTPEKQYIFLDPHAPLPDSTTLKHWGFPSAKDYYEHLRRLEYDSVPPSKPSDDPDGTLSKLVSQLGEPRRRRKP